jgi:V-type H+-transporting ATPase S1 subunit
MALSGLTVGEAIIDVKTLVLTFNESTVATTMLVNLKDPAEVHNIGMDIEVSGGTWYVKTFTYNNKRYFAASTVSAPQRRSYGCIELHLSDARNHIIFADIQIQPMFTPAEGETLTHFADRHNDCVGFFSPAIWGALFVVIILVLIMSCGITMMLDIRTMDRFDDPKGKTIIVNAQE